MGCFLTVFWVVLLSRENGDYLGSELEEKIDVFPHSKLKEKLKWVVEKAFSGTNKFLTFYI